MKLPEVLQNIKLGEKYICTRESSRIQSISLTSKYEYLFEVNDTELYHEFGIFEDDEFELERPKYSFINAYKELLNGKIIYNIENKRKFRLEDGHFYSKVEDVIGWTERDLPFEAEELLGEWYIY